MSAAAPAKIYRGGATRFAAVKHGSQPRDLLAGITCIAREFPYLETDAYPGAADSERAVLRSLAK